MIEIKNVDFLVGSKKFSNKSFEPFNEKVCDFLSDLSKDLNQYPSIKRYPDIATFSFWIRRNNINKFKDHFRSKEIRLGLGLLFHITPSNIPTNFAYSLVFGLITGNSNIIKVPARKFEQIDIICKSINKVLKKYKILKGMINIVRYNDHDILTKKIFITV